MAALDGYVTLVTLNVFLQNYSEVQFPERRTTIPAAEQAYSPNALTISTIKSWNPVGAGITDKVYEPIDNLLIQKDTNSRIRTILDLLDGNKYRPFTPTGRDDGYVGGGGIAGDGGGGIDFSGLGTEYLETANAMAYNTPRHGTRKSSLGLSIGGIDTSKLPDWVKAFSIVRTPPAGRVVCQGLAMYALIPQVPNSTPALYKQLDKIWFYSPEMDPVIGDKSYLFDAIKTNSTDYEVQLVSPVGFFTDVYSAHYNSGLPTTRVDMISYAIMGGNDIHSMEPTGFDTSAQIGAGSGRPTFGRFRNVYPTHPQGDGIINETLTFGIQSAVEPSILSYENNSDKSRTQYLEIGLTSNLYATNHIDRVLGNDAGARAFHEPWYIVNIVQNGKHIPNNNINSYKDIGNYIKLSSIIGKGNGEADQTFELVDEREEDVLTLAASATSYRYIYVDDKPWLGTNNLSAGDIDTYRTALEGSGSFTPSGGLACYGLYLYTSTTTTTGPSKIISFPYETVPSSNVICPGLGEKVEVRYNYNSPLTIFLGDTVVDDAIFAPIDTNITRGVTAGGVYLGAPMPFRQFNFDTTKYVRPSYKNTPETDYTHDIDYVRQWVVSFGCESTVNLPFMYKNYFPNRNYVIRPSLYDEKPEVDTEQHYLADHNIWSLQYATDYPLEYLTWGFGGFHLPVGYNFDYQKVLHTRAFTKPTSGSEEILIFMKRLHWSSESMVGYPSSRAFLPTNVYDLRNDKASQISILYDIMSDKGNNLYVITDYGSGLVLTDKKMLTDAGGNYLQILASESTLVQGELWLNPTLGCPKEFWRGKTEGNVKLANNIVVPILVFPTYTDIAMLSNNQFVAILDNNRKAIADRLALVDLAGTTFNTLLHSVVDETKNDLIVRIGERSFYFNFDINNWGGSVIHRSSSAGKEIVKTLFIPWLETNDVRSTVAQISYNPTNYHRDIALAVDTPIPVNQTPYYPYIIFSVTPILGDAYEFTDMFISATHKPYSVIVSTDKDFIISSTIPANKITEYNTGLYYIEGLPKAGNKKLIGKTLYVKINYADHNEFYGIKLVKIGYKEIVGG